MSDAANAPTRSAEHALGLIHDGSIVGLGSGRAATAFVHALGERVRNGLHVRGIPTSSGTAALATRLGIPLATLDDVDGIDVTVDGADEVDPRLDLVKGLGGALVREKIVAAASRQLVICVGSEKETATLGERGVLPIEVIPFALGFCRRRLGSLGFPTSPRMAGERLFVSDNGNYILDCRVGPIADPTALERSLLDIPGVVGTGLFLGMAHIVIVQEGDDVRIRRRDESA